MGGGKRLDGIISGDDRLRHSGYTVHSYNSDHPDYAGRTNDSDNSNSPGGERGCETCSRGAEVWRGVDARQER